MALPNTNISTTLVGTTLGSGSRDVGTLCTHPNINKWSKWKPVRFNKVTGLTEGELDSIKFGLAFDEYTSLSSFLQAYDSEVSFLQHLKPRGSSYNEFYRLGDFRNYNHMAPDFIYQNYPSGVNVYMEDGAEHLFHIIPVTNTNSEIFWEEVLPLSWFFGVTTNTYTTTHQNNIQYFIDNPLVDRRLTIPLNQLGIGQSTIIPILSSMPISQGIIPPDTRFTALNNTDFLVTVANERPRYFTVNNGSTGTWITLDTANMSYNLTWANPYDMGAVGSVYNINVTVGGNIWRNFTDINNIVANPGTHGVIPLGDFQEYFDTGGIVRMNADVLFDVQSIGYTKTYSISQVINIMM